MSVEKIIYKKPDPFLCDFDSARWAYLLSREMEYAYRKTQKLYRKQTLQADKALRAEEKLRQISEIYQQADLQIMDLVEEIKAIVK
jgi:hypothetical protein